jgi:signal transduction histidine kinase
MSRSITRRLIAYFVAVLLIFALLTAGIYILIFRRAVMSEARENLFDRGDRIAHLLVNWSFDDSDIDFCPDETDPATAEDSCPRPSRGRWGDGAGKGNATTSQGQGTGNVSSPGKGKQERRGVREYRFRTDRFLTWLSQIEAGELWLIDKETETVLTATDKSVSTSELPESIDTLLARVLTGESVYSEDFGTLLGTPSMTVGLPIRDEQGEIDSALFLHTSVEEATSGLTAAWQGLLLSLVIALIIVVLLAILLSRHFIDPLKRLQRTTAKLADGDYRARTNLDMQDEIGQLGDEIDMLAERLEEAESERHFTDASRRKFLSEISHELRTPVTVIRGSLEALRDGIVKEDDVREYYATMSDSAASLDRLISDLLELTRLDNPEFTLDMEKVNLQDVVEDAVRQIRQIASQKGVKIEFNVSDEHDEFYGDYGRLRQMLVNILNNAVKFTPSGSRVFVDYRLKGAAYASQRADAVISIRDEGIGMSEETIHHLFDRFYTTGKAGTDSTGLGLSIAKGIADRHTVEIDVVSREGEGSTFTLTFPPDDRHRVT